MVYRVIGLMSGSSLDGLDIVYTELHEHAGEWSFEIIEAECYPYSEEWTGKLKGAIELSALDYQLLHSEYGRFLGTSVNRFISEKGLDYKVALIASHGHTTFHHPEKGMTAQLGDGAAIAAVTRGIVVSDLRALDVAFGGQGAPIVPIGEGLLFKEFKYFLNVGGIANLSVGSGPGTVAFDVCAANRVLDMLVQDLGKAYDEGGAIAASGSVNESLLHRLNNLDYYRKPFPKSLANSFGTDLVFPMIAGSALTTADALATYVEHIAVQVKESLVQAARDTPDARLLVTGGGAFNTYLMQRLSAAVAPLGIEVVVPDRNIVQYKEALVMALIGVLRWRQEYNVLPSVTGAERGSIGGALWIGQEA